ncbi:MAG: S53 family peptidase, partial [Actinomycetes bacterium]
TTPMHITVSLALRNLAALRQSIASGRVMSTAQFNEQYAPTAASASQVVGYLQQAGFAHITPAANNALVTADGTAAAAESAFHTTIAAFTLGSRTVYANTAAALVPSALGGTINAVLGLNNVATMRPGAHPSGRAAATTAATTAATNPPSSCVIPGIGYPCTYNPQGFWKAYDATTASTGANTSVAIFAEGDLTQTVKDLRTEETANGLPQVPATIVPTGPASSDTSGADEWDMDTQYSTGMAQTVKQLYIYDATSLSDSDLTLAFNQFASQNVAKAGSASFGECEFQAYLDGSMVADDQAFAQAAAQGQTVFASSGDTGGFCPVAPNNGVPAGVPDVSYPASSPFVVSVGGTTLVTNADGSYQQEAAWLAGGGGVSYFEAPGRWQSTDGPVGTIAAAVCG